MGCDIHMYKEKHVAGKWVTADEWADVYGDGADVPYEKRFTDRNYNLFSILAGVRTREETGFEFAPRGLPIDVCPEVKSSFESWGGDAHTPSFLYLHELRDLNALLRAETIPVSGMKDAGELALLEQSIGSGSPDWDLLYPYCQDTNARSYKRFVLDVPAAFMVGSALDRLIATFDGVDGDNRRAVFWFDN